MRDTSVNPDSDSFSRSSTRTTYGEVLTDGTVIELVVSDERRLMLCTYDGSHTNLLPVVNFGNVLYAPPVLDPSLSAALRFPGPPAAYACLTGLYNEAVEAFAINGFSGEVSRLCPVIAMASWLPELFFEPLTVIAYGSDMHQAAILFSLLACMCRRPFLTAQLSRSLPFWVQPTVFTLAPDSSVKTCTFWRAANMPGVRVPSRAGTVACLASTRVLFTNDAEALLSWGPQALRLVLLPSARLSPSNEQQLAEIANYFQTRFLMFRLRQLANANASTVFSKSQPKFTSPVTSSQLLMLVEGEPEIISTLAPILEDQHQNFMERQARDPYRAIIECLWAPLHDTEYMTSKDLLKRLNTLLFARGERAEVGSRELGWKLRHLGLNRQRNGSGMLLLFSADFRGGVHQLARTFELDVPRFTTCRDCNNAFEQCS